MYIYIYIYIIVGYFITPKLVLASDKKLRNIGHKKQIIAFSAFIKDTSV